jgi:hypothetical protein
MALDNTLMADWAVLCEQCVDLPRSTQVPLGLHTLQPMQTVSSLRGRRLQQPGYQILMRARLKTCREQS